MFYDVPEDKLIQMGEAINMLAKTSLWPTIRRVPLDRQKAFIYAAFGYRFNFSVMDSLNSFFELNGKITMYGRAGKALIWRSGKCLRLEQIWDESLQAAITTCQRIGSEKPDISIFSLEDAQHAGLYPNKKFPDSPWNKYPKDMCKWKSFWRGAYNQFGDVLLGITPYEEEIDIFNRNSIVEKKLLKDTEQENELNTELLNVLGNTQKVHVEINEE